jgi:ligand-binding sensor domain-containing protein/serine phosphatase RsbU (regulator of sigma subunit)
MNRLKIYTFFYILYCYNIVLSQTYNFKNFTTEQGLPQSQVLTIYQDKIGNLWFGTNGGGAGKYNGNKINTITDNDGLISNIIYSITENASNELLFGTDKGISVYDGSKYSNFSEKDGLKSSLIFKLLNDNDKVWIGTQEGVYIYQNHKITRFTDNFFLSKSSVYTMFIDNNHNIWFGTIQNGIYYYNTKTKNFKNFTTTNGLSHNLVFSIGQNEKNELLVGTQEGLNIIDANFNITAPAGFERQENIAFSSTTKATSNSCYFGTFAEGMIEYDFKKNKKIKKYNLSNGLTNNAILSLFKDREQNIWIGTDGSGVYKFKNEKFTYYTKNNGLPENSINAVSQDVFGNIWIALKTNGLCKISKNGTYEFFKQNDPNSKGLTDNNVNAILSLKNGRVLFGTNEGFCAYENGKLHVISNTNFDKKYILTLFQSKNNTIWIGTNNGLFSYHNDVITEETSLNALKQEGLDLPIFSIGEDKESNLWVGTEQGVIKLDKTSKPTLYNKSNTFSSSRIVSIIQDEKQNLWFGTEEGVFHYDYKTFLKISQKNGLTSNACNFLQKDNNNRLIIGQNTGIDLLSISDFYKGKISIQHLGKADGLLSLESNFNASFKDKEGRILIGTNNGLEIYNPKLDTKNIQEAITTINSVKLFFGQYDINKYATKDSTSALPKDLKLPFNKNHLTFDYIGVSLTAPEKVLYQYKLEGLDENWTPPTSKTEATYSSLQPGKYTFFVKATNNDRVWNKEAVSYSFEILAPWYKTWWFYIICIIVLISSIMFYNSYKTKKLVADKQKLEAQVTERTKELREEKEKVEFINKEVIEQKSVIEHKNLEITDSIKYAKNIQEALLPSLNEVNSLFPNSFVLYMPKDIVSGDFYWFAKNGNTRFIAAVDCTGHGVPGAFMSIVGNTLLHEIINERNITIPGEILLELHKGVKTALNQNAKEFERRDGMDITICAFDNSNTVQYAGANRPLWIYRKNKNYELEVIKATKFPIGGIELEDNRTYENHTITVDEGDYLYLFSDGFADQFGGPKGKKYMVSNLQKTFLQNINLTMVQQKEALIKSFVDWRNTQEQVDDVLVIGIKI